MPREGAAPQPGVAHAPLGRGSHQAWSGFGIGGRTGPVSRDMSWLQACPEAGMAVGRSAGDGAEKFEGVAVWFGRGGSVGRPSLRGGMSWLMFSPCRSWLWNG